jgi:hypothetical protein
VGSKPEKPKKSESEKRAEQQTEMDLAQREMEAKEKEKQLRFGRMGLAGSIFTSQNGRRGLQPSTVGNIMSTASKRSLGA